MTNRTRINCALLQKIAKKTGNREKYVREQISKRASRLGITSEAAQVLWAKQLGIGTSAVLRKLPPHVQEQVRSTLPMLFSDRGIRQKSDTAHPERARRTDSLRLAIDYLLADQELKSRCSDLLSRHRYFDRVLREATTILENRIKHLAKIKGVINPEPLVSKALNPDPSKAILVVSPEPAEQAGFHSICRGIVLAFRHHAHHQLDEDVTREDALKFCGFIDVVLSVLGRARFQPEP